MVASMIVPVAEPPIGDRPAPGRRSWFLSRAPEALAATSLGAGGGLLGVVFAVERAARHGLSSAPMAEVAAAATALLGGTALGLWPRATVTRHRLGLGLAATAVLWLCALGHGLLPLRAQNGLFGAVCTGIGPAAAVGALVGQVLGSGRAILANSTCALAAAGLVLARATSFAGQGLTGSFRLAVALVFFAALVAAIRADRRPVDLRSAAAGAGATGALLGFLLAVELPALSADAMAAGFRPFRAEGAVLLALAVGVPLGAVLRAAFGRLAVVIAGGGVAAALGFALPAAPGEGLIRAAVLFVLVGCALGSALAAGAAAALWATIGLGAVLAGAATGSLESVPPPLRAAGGGLALALLFTRAAGLAWLAVAAAGTALLVATAGPQPAAAAESGALRRLAVCRGSAAEYLPRTQRLQLVVDGRCVDAVGPDRRHPELCATLAAALRPDADAVLVLGVGTGTTARAAATALPRARHRTGVDRTANDALRACFLGEGPLPSRGEPPVLDARPGGLRRLLRTGPPASADVVLFAEPLHPGLAFTATHDFQRELRAVAGTGLTIQPFYLDDAPPALLTDLLAAAAAVHPWVFVYLAGGCAALVTSGLEPDAPAPLAGAASWLGHAAGLGGAADVALACLGRVPPQTPARGEDELLLLLRAVRGTAAENLAVLGASIVTDDLGRVRLAATAAAPGAFAELRRHLGAHPDSVLLRRLDLDARLADAEAAVRRLPDASDQSQAAAAAFAAGFVHVGCPSALLHAALALPNRQGDRLAEPEAAAAIAVAIDPGVFAAVPPVLAGLPRPAPGTSPLEGFAVLPEPARLAALGAGDGALAVALRARFPSRCAHALVEVRKSRRWTPAEVEALRQLADPFVLAAAGEVLRRQAAARELLSLWRGDLAMPVALADLARGTPVERVALAQALACRADARSLAALADALVDLDVAVRTAAGAALLRTAGDRVPYDPEWPRSRLLAAAERVRTLHNRLP
jgi:hypothetical protein